MIIHIITPSVDYSYMYTQLNEPTNQNSIKLLIVVQLANKKMLL